MGSEHPFELFGYSRNDGDADPELPSSCPSLGGVLSLFSFKKISNAHFLYPFAVSALLTCFTCSSLSDDSNTTVSALRSVRITDFLCSRY